MDMCGLPAQVHAIFCSTRLLEHRHVRVIRTTEETLRETPTRPDSAYRV